MGKVILKTGEKIASLAGIEGDYEHWLLNGLGWSLQECQIIRVYENEALPAVEEVTAIAITGSGAMVTDGSAWIEQSATWLRQLVQVGTPCLGICFGHQLLAHALGGRVDDNPNGVEVGTVEISLSDAARRDPLLKGLPDSFPAQLSHRQCVLQLPPQAIPLARSAMDTHQAFSYRDRAWGLQFHPEFDEHIIPHFIRYYQDSLQAKGRNSAELLQQVTPSPVSAALLKQFAALCPP